MNKHSCDEKLKFIKEITDFILGQPYDPEKFAQYVHVKSLDEKSYRYNDDELDHLLDIIGGMSAGEEFYYSKDEVLEMLRSFTSELK